MEVNIFAQTPNIQEMNMNVHTVISSNIENSNIVQKFHSCNLTANICAFSKCAIQAANGLGWDQFQWSGFATWAHLVQWQMG
jgi:hypothetical protein